MHPTIRTLLAESSLHLTLLEPGRDGALDSGVSWAHSSDLVDPTPFLDAGQVLLTTGTQFTGAGAAGAAGEEGRADYAEYIARLSARGIAALGFGTEVATSGTPAELARACAQRGLPLFEVPYQVPFIAIGRFVADRVAAAEHARDSWALGAMRSISFAALRPDGLGATLSELARQLDRSVLLFDAGGVVTHADHGEGADLGGDLQDAIAAEALRLLERGQRSGSTMTVVGANVSLQTIGRRSELRGVLAVAGTTDLDASDQTVVTSVVALVGVALEQGRMLSGARAAVRRAAVRALLDARADLAGLVLAELGEHLPTGEVVVARVRGGDGTSEERLVPAARTVAAEVDEELVLIGNPAEVETAAIALGRAGRTAGLSASAPLGDAPRAYREAGTALEATTATAPVLRSTDLGSRGVDWLLERAGTRDVAATVLRPIAADDDLLESLSVWLETNGQTDPAARRLGVHRHTLRSRISTIERLLDRDLSSFASRAELWIALRALARA